jgi:hypothetical protein
MRIRFASVLIAALVLIAGCGGGGGSSPSSSTPAITQNVQTISVDPGPANSANIAFVSVTVCMPGTMPPDSICQTIDHVALDTGSTGLRLMSAVLSSSLSLPPETDVNGNPIVECTQFADGFSWGPLKVADIKIAGEQANSVPIQVIGDPKFSTVPADCLNVGPSEDTVQTFGANGILGAGLFLQDCGIDCTQNSLLGFYYVCPSTGCQPTVVSLAQQALNPVALFAADNNGVLIQMPAVPAAGAATVSGSLIFGIGTQSNNGLGGAHVFAADPNLGTIVTTYNNQVYGQSFIDSGTNVLSFIDDTIPICQNASFANFYCPGTTLNLSATNLGANGMTGAVTFSVANTQVLLSNNPSFTAFNNLAAYGSASMFDWGLPFFYGRNVFTAIETKATPGGSGPYFAY